MTSIYQRANSLVEQLETTLSKHVTAVRKWLGPGPTILHTLLYTTWYFFLSLSVWVVCKCAFALYISVCVSACVCLYACVCVWGGWVCLHVRTRVCVWIHMFSELRQSLMKNYYKCTKLVTILFSFYFKSYLPTRIYQYYLLIPCHKDQLPTYCFPVPNVSLFISDHISDYEHGKVSKNR